MAVSKFNLRLQKKETLMLRFFFANLGDFEISSGGYILVKKTLDAEVKPLYTLTIEAKDQGQPSRSNTVSNY